MLLLLQESCVRHWLASILIIGQLATMLGASGVWRDAEPKLVSTNSFTNFRSFQGQHFGSMTFSPDQRLLMVGSQNSFYLLDLQQPIGSKQGVRNYTWSSEYITIENCLMKGVEEWECQNFIEVVQPNPEDNNKLFVCGTNAQTPRCRYFTDGGLSQYDESDGTFISPFNPKQEGTALFAGGNLYTGAARDYTARDSVVFRSQGLDTVLTSKAMDSKWLKIPAFVNSFDVGEWVMFFFREVAVEYTSGDAVYSRVAKVCKSDQGGEWISNGQWTTFQKIRLNCSFPGAFPFYFNFLQDVFMVPTDNDTTFYAVFTTGPHEIPGSAVCVFSLNTIQTIMNHGEFKEQQSGAWYPASPPVSQSFPRPGNCNLDSRTLSSQSTQWITTHPLMHESVPNHHNPLPIFDLTRADFRLTQVVVHTQRGVDGDYEVLFLGSDDSRILKIVLVSNEDGTIQSNLLEEISLHPEQRWERVINMEIVENHEGKEVLVVNTNSSILEVPLQRCNNYTSKCGCVQDPYCVWNNFSNECYEFTGDNTYDDQDVPNIQECPDGDHEGTRKLADASSNAATQDNNLPEGKKTPSMSPSTTLSNVIGPLDPGKNQSLLDNGNALVLVFLILGWILFSFCGLVVLYQCYNQHHKGIYQPTSADDSILSTNKLKELKDLTCIPNQNGKVPHCGPPPNGILMEDPWLPPCRTSHTPAGQERESLGPVNGHSLPRRPVPVPTPTVPASYRTPLSYAHTVGSLPSPARVNKYKNGTSTFNSLDRHRTPPIHNIYVEDPRSHELYAPYIGGRMMTAEDRRPSGASDSEMYDDDVWQPRVDGEELV